MPVKFIGLLNISCKSCSTLNDFQLQLVLLFHISASCSCLHLAAALQHTHLSAQWIFVALVAEFQQDMRQQIIQYLIIARDSSLVMWVATSSATVKSSFIALLMEAQASSAVALRFWMSWSLCWFLISFRIASDSEIWGKGGCCISVTCHSADVWWCCFSCFSFVIVNFCITYVSGAADVTRLAGGKHKIIAVPCIFLLKDLVTHTNRASHWCVTDTGKKNIRQNSL